MVYHLNFRCCAHLDADAVHQDATDEELIIALKSTPEISSPGDARVINHLFESSQKIRGLILNSNAEIARRQQSVFDSFSIDFNNLVARQTKCHYYISKISSHLAQEDSMRSFGANSIDSTVKLNVGGKEFNIMRSTAMVENYDLNILFILLSDRWGSRTPIDVIGRVFLNIDPTWIEHVLNSLHEESMSKPVIAEENRTGFDAVISYYNLSYLLHGSKLLLPEISSIGCMNLPSYADFLYSFLLPELSYTPHSQTIKLSLIYRGTRDGFQPANFHACCDGKFNTICIIESESGHVFGGYAEGAWQKSGNDLQNKKSFLYSLKGLGSHQKFPRQYSERQPNVGNLDDYLFFFGVDLTVAAKGKTVSRLGTMYSNNNSATNLSLAGTDTFVVHEIEVYQIMDQPILDSTELISDQGESLSESTEDSYESWINMGSARSKEIVKELRTMTKKVDEEERKLLIECLWMEHMSVAVHERNVKEGMLADWQNMVDDALSHLQNNVETLDLILESMDRLDISDSSENEEIKCSPDQHDVEDEVISFDINGTIIAVLKSTLVRHSPGSVFELGISGAWIRDAESGHISLVGYCTVLN